MKKLTSIAALLLFAGFSAGFGFVLNAFSFLSESNSGSQNKVVLNFLKEQRRQETQLTAYHSTRQYVLRTPEKNKVSIAEVEMTYNTTEGEHFKILQWYGSGGIYRYALQKILDAEADLTRPQNRSNLSFSLDNYQFEVLGKEHCADHSCYVLRMEPRRKLSSLLEGRLWIDQENYGLIRLEGHVVASSFWVGQPYIIQSFRYVNGFRMLRKSSWSTKARGIGETALSIEVLSQDVPLSKAPVAISEIR